MNKHHENVIQLKEIISRGSGQGTMSANSGSRSCSQPIDSFVYFYDQFLLYIARSVLNAI